MRDSFAPIRLRFERDGFLIEARLLFGFDYRIPAPDRKRLMRAAEAGIRKIWTFSLPLDAETEKSIRHYLEKREPWSLPAFERYLEREKRTEEEVALQKATSMLRQSLLALKDRRQPATLPAIMPMPGQARIRVRAICGSETARFPRLRYLQSFLQGSRRPLLIHFKPYRIMPAHVNSGLLRRFWGIFRNRTLISLGFNWSPKFPGRIFLPTRYNLPLLERVAAHEFGHCMGLGDAYSAWYRCYDESPGTRSYLMHSNGPVSAEELRMLLTARVREKMLNFPFRCSFKQFRKGLGEEAQSLSRKFARRK